MSGERRWLAGQSVHSTEMHSEIAILPRFQR